MNIPTERLRSDFNRRPQKDSREENITYEESEESVSVTDIDFTVWAEYDRSHCTLHDVRLGRKYDILWITIPFFVIGALAGFTNIYKMAKKIYGLGRKDRKK